MGHPAFPLKPTEGLNGHPADPLFKIERKARACIALGGSRWLIQNVV
jgi:hypothetical protein